MDPFLMHLLLIALGFVIALGALRWFARVTGGYTSFTGMILLTFLALAGSLILAGLGVVTFPGMPS